MPTNYAHSEVLKFAFPCTFVNEAERLWILAGEDIRVSIDAPQTAKWILPLLKMIDGATDSRTLIEESPPSHRHEAAQLIDRLKGERLLIEVCTTALRVTPSRYLLKVSGRGAVFEKLIVSGAARESEGGVPLAVLCQDDLNYQAARVFSRECLAAGSACAWISYGARARAFVSPVFLPESGPCLECLLDNFENLSPLPELYEALARHAERRGEFSPVDFPAHAAELLGEIFLEKLRLLEAGANSPAVFRLHVFEIARLEVESHRILRDPACRACGARR